MEKCIDKFIVNYLNQKIKFASYIKDEKAADLHFEKLMSHLILFNKDINLAIINLANDNNFVLRFYFDDYYVYMTTYYIMENDHELDFETIFDLYYNEKRILADFGTLDEVFTQIKKEIQ